MDDGLYRLCNKLNNSRHNQDEPNDQVVEQWRTPVWTRSNHRRTQHFFLATQLYLIFYKKIYCSSFRIFDKSYLGISHFTLRILLKYSIIGWTIKKFRTFCLKWVKRFLVVSLWVVKHFTIPQRRFFSSRLCRVKWPITVPYSEKNANNGKERTHKTTIFLKIGTETRLLVWFLI